MQPAETTDSASKVTEEASAKLPPHHDPDVVLPLKQSIPLGLQHVLAMFASNATIPVLLANAIGATPEQTTYLVQAAILVAGLATLVQTIGIGVVGARLPIVQGSGFAFAAVAIPLASQYGLPAVFGGALVAAVVQFAIGFAIKYFLWLFKPLVMGIVLTSVGLGLLPVGIGLAAGGVGSPDFGSATNWILALTVLVIAIVLNRYGKGLFSSAGVLIALIVGYLMAIPMGKIDFATVGEAGWVSVAIPLRFGIAFEPAAILAMTFVGVVTLLDSIGTMAAVTGGGANRPPTQKEISGAVMADGVGTALGSMFGSVPVTTLSQNAGLVVVNRSMSRHTVSVGGVILVLLSLLPKGSAVIASMPSAVLGGAALMLFGSVLVVGIQMLGESGINPRTSLIIAVALALGQGMALVPETVAGAPEMLRVLLTNAVVVSTVIVLILDKVFRENEQDRAFAPEEAAGGDPPVDAEHSLTGVTSQQPSANADDQPVEQLEETLRTTIHSSQ